MVAGATCHAQLVGPEGARLLAAANGPCIPLVGIVDSCRSPEIGWLPPALGSPECMWSPNPVTAPETMRPPAGDNWIAKATGSPETTGLLQLMASPEFMDPLGVAENPVASRCCFSSPARPHGLRPRHVRFAVRARRTHDLRKSEMLGSSTGHLPARNRMTEEAPELSRTCR